MTSWRIPGSSKISLKQKLLTKNEFNFTNKFLWKLPEISSKFKSVSPVFSPSRNCEARNSRIRKHSTVGFCEEPEKSPELKANEISINTKFPRFFIEGTQKKCNQQYFKKSYISKILIPKKSPQKSQKVSVSIDTELDAWDIEY